VGACLHVILTAELDGLEQWFQPGARVPSAVREDMLGVRKIKKINIKLAQSSH
jgi:hypothetical protein